MGFPREEALTALAAAFGNAERAVEYLFNGIPPEAMASATPPVAAPVPEPATAPAPAPAPSPFSAASVLAAANPAPATAPASAPGAFTAASIMAALQPQAPAPAAEPTPLQRMQADLQLMQLVALVRQNPTMLQPLLEELSRSNPTLLQFINAHQADFQALLNQAPVAPVGDPAPAVSPAEAAPGEQVRIQLAPEEGEAVARLMQLGFTQDAALQAFLAADKNETLAANLLFDGAFD